MFAADDETEAERAERKRKELPWYRGVTWKDIKDIMPTGTFTLGYSGTSHLSCFNASANATKI